MNNLDKKIKEASELARKHEELRNEFLNDPNVPQVIKDDLNKLHKEFEEKMLEDKKRLEKRLEENKHRKIIGYNPENFEPIYEDE